MDADLYFLSFESRASTAPQRRNSWLKIAGVFVSRQAATEPQTHIKRPPLQLKRTSNAPQGTSNGSQTHPRA